MNRFDAYITYYLYENKEVTLEKIGTLKVPASFSPGEGQADSVEFTCNKKAITSEGLIDFITEKASKNKSLVISDIESHLSQVREFINIGKSYEIPEIGFIKANKSGLYEFAPFSEVNKPARVTAQQTKQTKNNSRATLQVITVIIVIAILAGLGWQAYQYFSKPKINTTTSTVQLIDSSATAVDTSSHAGTTAPDTVANVITSPGVDSNTIKNVRYIFEITASYLRAQSRTAQLKSFGNSAFYDSFTNNNIKYYSLYIEKPTRIADTSKIKDSLARFFQKQIQVKIPAGNN